MSHSSNEVVVPFHELFMDYLFKEVFAISGFQRSFPEARYILHDSFSVEICDNLQYLFHIYPPPLQTAIIPSNAGL
jgi:hypothetical protein